MQNVRAVQETDWSSSGARGPRCQALPSYRTVCPPWPTARHHRELGQEMSSSREPTTWTRPQ